MIRHNIKVVTDIVLLLMETQNHDEKVMQSTVKYPEWYSHKTINNVENSLGHTKPGDNLANWKIALSEDLMKPII